MDFPKSVPSVGLVDGKFIDEDAVAGTPGSLIPSAWGNAVTQEILKVIQDSGLDPDEDNNAQLSAAIDRKISSSSVAFATQVEAEGGTNTTKAMSPLRVFQAIAKVVTQATETSFGWLKISTLSQTNTGTDDATAITPKKLAAAVQTQTLSAGTTGGTATAYTVSNIPGLLSYVAKLRLNVTFHVGGGANPTISLNAIGARSLKQYDASGAKVPAVIIAGMVSDIAYDGTDFVLLNQLPVSPVQRKQSFSGLSKNLKVSANGISASVQVTADNVIVANSAGDAQAIGSVSLTLNTGAVASASVDGMASGITAANTWYAVYAWYSTSLNRIRITGDSSFTAPTAPTAAFDSWALISVFRTDASGSKFPLGFTQAGVKWRYVVKAGTNLTAPMLIASGSTGGVNPTTQLAINLVVCPGALVVSAGLTAQNGTAAVVSTANNGSAWNSLAFPPPLAAGAQATTFAMAIAYDLVLEQPNAIFWGCNGAGGSLIIHGFEVPQ